jgi:hypothetical protein
VPVALQLGRMWAVVVMVNVRGRRARIRVTSRFWDARGREATEESTRSPTHLELLKVLEGLLDLGLLRRGHVRHALLRLHPVGHLCWVVLEKVGLALLGLV